MIFKQIRDTAFVLDYAGTRFLVNPVLGALEPSVSLGTLLDVDAVIATDLSGSCFDEAARQLIPRGMKIFVQGEKDAEKLSGCGFSNIEILTENGRFQYLDIRRTPAFYSRKGQAELNPASCGVMIMHPVLNSTYIIGNSVWHEGIKETIQRYKPRLIIVNAGNGQLLDDSKKTMNQDEIAAVHLTMPKARIIAVGEKGLEADKLDDFVRDHRMEKSVMIPEEGKEYLI